MKTMTLCAALAATAGFASAEVYNDSVGDIFDAGLTNLDIQSVELTNDADWLYVSVTAGSSLDDTNWGKYAIGINNGKDTADTGNGWGRPINWNGQSITHWSATWADEGGSDVGGEIYDFDGTWNLVDATYAAGTEIQGDDSLHGAGVQMWRISLASLNLVAGDTFTFDVISSGGGGGDPGVDQLSNAGLSTPGWGTESTAGTFLSYTVVPTPGALAIIGMGGLVAARRRR